MFLVPRTILVAGPEMDPVLSDRGFLGWFPLQMACISSTLRMVLSTRRSVP